MIGSSWGRSLLLPRDVLSDIAFHENAVYVKRKFAILMLFLLLSFLKPTLLTNY
jgi:hypothetical protein